MTQEVDKKMLEAEVKPNEKVPEDNTAQLMAEYIKEKQKAWDGDMLDYFRKKTSSLHRLSNGGIIAFEKIEIKKDFCFGYRDSAYDTKEYDEANNMAKIASESEEYFLNANLSYYDNKISSLTNERDLLYIYMETYFSEKEPLNVWRYALVPRYYVINGEHGYKDLTECNDEDYNIILNALKQERTKFEKRLKAYLKRYGMSKVNTWSYWADR